MGNLLLRDVPEDVVSRLEARARANGRSAEAEHREILRRALSGEDSLQFEFLAAQLRSMTAVRTQTPSEEIRRKEWASR